ncbi:hypothetical protein [Stutzerimonas chloritidismutans]
MAAIEMEVREYKEIEELKAIEGFQPDAPFTQDDYQKIIGEYHLLNKVKCCLLKKNHPCATEHNYGFVIRLKNGIATLIGNSCANDNFEAATALRKDINSFRAAKTRRQKLEQIKNVLNNENEIIALLKSSEKTLKDAQKTTSIISQEIGSETTKKLREMSSTRNNSVQIALARTKTSINEKTKERESHTTKFSATIGFIAGCEIFNTSSWDTLQRSINKLRDALSKAKLTQANPKSFSNQKINSVALELNEISNLELLSKNMSEANLAFKNNNPLLLGYITENKIEKLNAAKYSLKLSEKLSGKNQARALIEQFETKLKAQNNADRITTQTTDKSYRRAS